MADVGKLAWREALLRRMLVVVAVLGTAALTAAMAVISDARVRLLSAPFYGFLGLLALAAFRPSWPYRLRAGAVVGTFVLATFVSYCVAGFQGDGAVEAACAVVAAALLFGRPVMHAVLAALLASVAVAAAGMVTGVLSLPPPAYVSLTKIAAWVGTGSVAFFLWILVGFAVTYAVEHIESYAQSEREALSTLRDEQAKREQAEKQRREAEGVAQQAQKLELVGQLSAGVAHDLNNVLAVVQCWAELAAKPDADAAQRAEARASILAASRQGAALAQQFLSIGRRSARSARDLRLDEAVDSSLLVLRRILPEDIDVRIEHAGPTLVRADEMDLQQVTLNFVVNARDAMPHGGRLRISTGVQEVSAERPVIGGRLAPGRWGFLAVEDTGPGVAPSIQERIFEPFFTTKPVGSGTGLGLATVLHIARESGGAVELQSRRGEGARFVFYFPESRADSASAIRSSPPRHLAASPRHASILVVEDNVAIRQLIQSILEDRGHKVVTAADGHRAMQLLGADSQRFDLLCTDGVLPGESAPTVIAAFEAACPARPVLVVSGYVQEELTVRGIEQGRYRLLRKPFSIDDLSLAVDELLEA